MKISLPSDSKQSIGGGWSFKSNLTKGLQALGETIVQDPLEADVALICGVTMVSKETMRALKEKGVKIVVRLDNVPRNTRNRGNGTNRLFRFSEMADQVVWQGEWSKYYLEDYIAKEGRIIHNGIDLGVFKEQGDSFFFDDRGRDNYYLYSRFSRDETKMWEVAWYEYQMLQREKKDAKLLILGRFSDDLRQYDFDFFRGENFEYLGIVDEPERMAKILRSVGHLMATYYNDAFSNTYLEALACGVNLYKPSMTGGTPEMMDLWNKEGRNYFSLHRMAQEYLDLFNEL